MAGEGGGGNDEEVVLVERMTIWWEREGLSGDDDVFLRVICQFDWIEIVYDSFQFCHFLSLLGNQFISPQDPFSIS